MFALKGFVPHKDFVTNIPGNVSVIGELSPLSLTFSREVGYYTDDAYPRIVLAAFTSKQDSVTVEVNETNRVQTLKISNFVYENTINHSGEVFADELLQKLTNTFAAEADNFQCGQIINEGLSWMPEWVSWKSKLIVDGSGAIEENLFKVWFVDSNFQTHYDEYEIIVVPPLDNLDDFFRTGQEVKLLLESLTIPQIIEKSQTAKGGIPESVIRSETFDYYDPLNAQNIVPSQWGLLIYGLAGDNIDSIKDALVDYVLAHSTHTRDEWVVILPDLFRRTEFTLVPRWDQYAIPDRASQTGVYTPQANLMENLAMIKTFATTYTPETHINEHTAVMGFPYKSLYIASVGSPENRNAQYELYDVYPQLINVSSSSPDFMRMDQATQEFALALYQMILDAEKIGPYDSVTQGYSKVIRDGKLYVVKSLNNIHYLVAAKHNFSS